MALPRQTVAAQDVAARARVAVVARRPSFATLTQPPAAGSQESVSCRRFRRRS
jgi:hypothetical protein